MLATESDASRVYKVLKHFSEKDGLDIGDLLDKEHADAYALCEQRGTFVSHVLRKYSMTISDI